MNPLEGLYVIISTKVTLNRQQMANKITCISLASIETFSQECDLDLENAFVLKQNYGAETRTKTVYFLSLLPLC